MMATSLEGEAGGTPHTKNRDREGVMWNISDLAAQAGSIPVYKLIAGRIGELAASGRLPPGGRLPAERTLARLFGVNRSTVVRAFDELEERGLLLRKRGSGTYVAAGKWGVQSYATLNWREPPALLAMPGETAFRREAAVSRERAAREGTPFLDLSGDDLAPDLLPELAAEGSAGSGKQLEKAWKEAVKAERGEEAAHLGLPSLRRAVAHFLRPGADIPEDTVLITSGSRQAIFLITQCLLRPGDAVGVEAPSYFYSLPVFQAAGIRLCALPVDEGGVTLDGLAVASSRRSLKMIFLNPVFQNPTGAVMRDARKRDVLAFCAKTRIPIVEDDAYSRLFFRNRTDLAPIKAWDGSGQVIYIGSLSSYAGRNLRAGWLAAPPPVIARLAGARHMMDAGLSVLPQLLAREYLGMAEEHLPGLRKSLAGRSGALMSRLRGICGDGLVFSPPGGGLYLYAEAREKDAESLKRVRRELFGAGLVPAPGEEFGDAPGFFRFNCSMFRM